MIILSVGGRRQIVLTAELQSTAVMLQLTQTQQFKKLEQCCHQMQSFTHPRFKKSHQWYLQSMTFRGPTRNSLANKRKINEKLIIQYSWNDHYLHKVCLLLRMTSRESLCSHNLCNISFNFCFNVGPLLFMPHQILLSFSSYVIILVILIYKAHCLWDVTI